MESEMREEIGNVDPILREGIGSLPERLAEVLERESLRSFAKQIGVSEGALRTYLKGRVPRADDAVAIARATGYNIEWLLTGNGAKRPYEVKEQELPYVLSSHGSVSVDEFNEEYSLIRGYHVEVSAGPGCTPLDDEHVSRHLAFRKRWLKFRGLTPSDLAVVFARGDSMAPTIQTGDSILIDTSKIQFVDGKIFVLRMGGDVFAKRLQRYMDGGINIISDNPAYPMLTIPAAQMESVSIIGQVVWVGHDIF